MITEEAIADLIDVCEAEYRQPGEFAVSEFMAKYAETVREINHGQARRPRMLPRALRRPETRRSCFLAMPRHTTLCLALICFTFGKPALHLVSVFFWPFALHALRGTRCRVLASSVWW